MDFTCVDPFCGGGGLALGLKEAGFKLIFSFDADEHCCETLRLNPKYFGHKVEKRGIEDFLNGRLLEHTNIKKGELFLVAGGPPCQGFSIQRIGKDNDERNNLIGLFLKLVEDLQPLYFLMENVPGIKGKRGKDILAGAINFGVNLGYKIHRKELDAQDFGVPQRRRRFFLVGERLDAGLPSFQFPVPTTPLGHRITVRQVIGHLPSPPEDGSDHPSFVHHRQDRLSETNKKRLAALKPGQGREFLPAELLADCHKIDAEKIGHRNVYGRMSWDDVAPTITARFDSFTRGLFGHPRDIRSISLREGALLQTFPPDFIFSGNKVDVARQIGNAVPPLLAKAIGKKIIESYLIKTGKGEPACASRH